MDKYEEANNLGKMRRQLTMFISLNKKVDILDEDEKQLIEAISKKVVTLEWKALIAATGEPSMTINEL